MVGKGSVLVQQAWVGKAGGRTVFIGHIVDLLFRYRWFLGKQNMHVLKSVLITALQPRAARARTELHAK